MSRPRNSKAMGVEKARDIRIAYRNGFSVGEIAKEFEVKYQTVYSIVKRKTWKYV